MTQSCLYTNLNLNFGNHLMRTINNIEMAHVAGAAGDTVPFSVIGGTILGGVVGALYNVALQETVISNHQTTCESASSLDCFIKATSLASTYVAPRIVLHVLGFAFMGLGMGTAYALNS